MTRQIEVGPDEVVRDPVDNVYFNKTLWSVGSFAALFVFWQVLAVLINSRYFPGVPEVWTAMVDEFQSGELTYHIGITLIRVAFAFVFAMTLGSAIGIVMGRVKSVNRFFDSWLIFFLNLPALVTIILCYVWMGLTEVAAVIAVAVNKIPNVAVTLRDGARSLNPDYTEMAKVYKMGWWKTLRHVTVPQLAPFFATAARTGLSLVWKIVLVVELIGRSDGVGQKLHTSFQLFDVPTILAYAIAFILVVQLIEVLILQPIEARVNRWRR